MKIRLNSETEFRVEPSETVTIEVRAVDVVPSVEVADPFVASQQAGVLAFFHATMPDVVGVRVPVPMEFNFSGSDNAGRYEVRVSSSLGNEFKLAVLPPSDDTTGTQIVAFSFDVGLPGDEDPELDV